MKIQKLSASLESSTYPVLVFESDTGRFMECNASAVELLDRDRNALYGLTLKDMVGASSGFQSCPIYSLRGAWTRKDGQTISLEYLIIRREEIILVVCRDLKDNGFSRNLMEKEERLSAFLRAFDGFIFVRSRDNRIEFMNERLIRRIGRDATGEPCWKALQDFKEVCSCSLADKVFDGEAARWEVKNPVDNRWYYVVESPLHQTCGAVSRQTIILDITERKLAEEALKASHESLLAILDSLDAAVYVADMQTYEILFVNRYIKSFFGDITGKLCWQSIQAGQNAPCDFCTNKLLLTPDGEPGDVLTWEFRNTVNGLLYEIHDRSIRWIDGRLVRLEIAYDITDRKMREEDVLRTNKLSAIGRFAAGVAHEINNPLANASINLHVLRKKMAGADDSDGSPLKIIAEIERNIDKAALIAIELLDFSRQGPYIMGRTDVNEVIGEALLSIEYMLEGITVQKGLCALPAIKADPAKIEQALMNILKNSTEAMPDGGVIDIKTAHKDGHVVIEISDTGTGISPEDIAKVFEPFFTTKEVGKGTGLGLSICYGIVRQHNGKIEISSAPGNGTTVVIKLPVESAAE